MPPPSPCTPHHALILLGLPQQTSSPVSHVYHSTPTLPCLFSPSLDSMEWAYRLSPILPQNIPRELRMDWVLFFPFLLPPSLLLGFCLLQVHFTPGQTLTGQKAAFSAVIAQTSSLLTPLLQTLLSLGRPELGPSFLSLLLLSIPPVELEHSGKGTSPCSSPPVSPLASPHYLPVHAWEADLLPRR